jgi:hypothetical protein
VLAGVHKCQLLHPFDGGVVLEVGGPFET